MSGAAGGGGGAGTGVWAEASAWVAALARATCWRKVRRLVDIRYRVLSGGDGWGAKDMARYLGEFARGGLINIAGGCCGNTPEHIAAIARALEGKHPRELREGS